jgi:hypothetical protein
MTLQERRVTPHLSDHRADDLPQSNGLIAVTNRGTGQIITISREGISFGCLYPHTFPQELSLDILDGHGAHIEQLKVRKIWEMNRVYTDFCKEFELVIGAQFVNLSDHQAAALERILEKQQN